MIISCRKLQALSIPHKNNGFHAVYEVCLTSPSGQTVCAVGEAQGNNESEIKGLLQQAEENAHTRALGLLEAHSFAVEDSTPILKKWSEESPLSMKNTYNNIPYAKKAGGGSNPISPKQVDLIKKLCKNKGIDVHTCVMEKFGTDLYSLAGWQADKIIKELS